MGAKFLTQDAVCHQVLIKKDHHYLTVNFRYLNLGAFND